MSEQGFRVRDARHREGRGSWPGAARASLRRLYTEGPAVAQRYRDGAPGS